ncbi:hypothetical protein EVA_06385 [gut metagenome]|uniref:Uncharacterized protein n=1 Tax=gut metagenome TaxID=749906 RepID=J9GF28_9ZZZZ
MKHGDDIHTSFIICCLRFPTNEHAQKTCIAKIIVRLHIIVFNTGKTVYHKDQLTHISLIEYLIRIKQVVFLFYHFFGNTVYCYRLHQTAESTIQIKLTIDGFHNFTTDMESIIPLRLIAANHGIIPTETREIIGITNLHAHPLRRYRRDNPIGSNIGGILAQTAHNDLFIRKNNIGNRRLHLFYH